MSICQNTRHTAFLLTGDQFGRPFALWFLTVFCLLNINKRRLLVKLHAAVDYLKRITIRFDNFWHRAIFFRSVGFSAFLASFSNSVLCISDWKQPPFFRLKFSPKVAINKITVCGGHTVNYNSLGRGGSLGAAPFFLLSAACSDMRFFTMTHYPRIVSC